MAALIPFIALCTMNIHHLPNTELSTKEAFVCSEHAPITLTGSFLVLLMQMKLAIEKTSPHDGRASKLTGVIDVHCKYRKEHLDTVDQLCLHSLFMLIDIPAVHLSPLNKHLLVHGTTQGNEQLKVQAPPPLMHQVNSTSSFTEGCLIY